MEVIRSSIADLSQIGFVIFLKRLREQLPCQVQGRTLWEEPLRSMDSNHGPCLLPLLFLLAINHLAYNNTLGIIKGAERFRLMMNKQIANTEQD